MRILITIVGFSVLLGPRLASAEDTKAAPAKPAPAAKGAAPGERPQRPPRREPTPEEKAMMESMDRAGQHYQAGRYREAATEMEKHAVKAPIFWWNVGDSWDRAGEGKKAIAAYKKYIDKFPKDHVIPDVKARIAIIEKAHFKGYKLPDPPKAEEEEAAAPAEPMQSLPPPAGAAAPAKPAPAKPAPAPAKKK